MTNNFDIEKQLNDGLRSEKPKRSEKPADAR
jgi:hypothetical protein